MQGNGNDQPDLAEPLPRQGMDFEQLAEPANRGALVAGGGIAIQTQGREITARKVAVPRDLKKIQQQLKVFCAQFGETFYYSWEANDRRNRRKALIEGGTIKLANTLVNLWGNCAVEVDVHETPSHWVLKAFFIDYERGVAVSRLFQQRKSQDTGMRDGERQADIVFQIGQSKAIRNVVLNALSALADFAIDESKLALTIRFKDPETAKKAHGFVTRVMEENGIALLRVEAVVGRKRDKWTVQDLARVYAEMRGIHEGLTVASEVYPSEADAAEVESEKAGKAEAAKGEPSSGAPAPAPAAATAPQAAAASQAQRPAEDDISLFN